MDDLTEWLTQILKEDKARLSAPTFCGPVWPTTDQMLARIAADRQILALHGNAGRGQVLTTSGFQGIRATCTRCGMSDEYGVPWPCKTVRLLALPYADRPGYQEAWRP